MILHVLPGDGIVEAFRDASIEGDVAVCREALIDGDVSGDTLPEFWENRARVVARDHPEASEDFHESVVREFAKLTALQSGSEINLWFEYELFCQINLWFCLSLLTDSTAEIFRVEPVTLSNAEIWDGFGNLAAGDLRKCLAARVRLSRSDVELGGQLWSAYRTGDHEELKRLSEIDSPAFPKLRAACVAATEKDSRPQQIIGEIIQSGETEFEKIFLEFKVRGGEYGYGDVQVKKLWQALVL